MELNKGYTTATIKQIMQSRYEIIVSKRGIQKIIKKYDTTRLYEDNGRPVKLSERSRRIIRRMSLKNRTMSVRIITSNFNIQRTEHAYARR